MRARTLVVTDSKKLPPILRSSVKDDVVVEGVDNCASCKILLPPGHKPLAQDGLAHLCDGCLGSAVQLDLILVNYWPYCESVDAFYSELSNSGTWFRVYGYFGSIEVRSTLLAIGLDSLEEPSLADLVQTLLANITVLIEVIRPHLSLAVAGPYEPPVGLITQVVADNSDAVQTAMVAASRTAWRGPIIDLLARPH